MSDHPETGLPKRTPTLYGIVLFKLGKGVLFLLLALMLYTLSDNDLPREFGGLVRLMHLDPGHQLFQDITAKLARVSEENMLWVAGGTVAYGALALTEAIGLGLRFQWAGYLAIAEGGFFIPIEIYELSHVFTWGLTLLLVINVIIVFYLWQNRDRIFRHKAAPGPELHRHQD